MSDGTESRAAAARLVLGVIEKAQPLSDQISRGGLGSLSPSDRARAQRLAMTTLRRLTALDAVLRPLLRKQPPAFVRAIILVGLAEILVEGAPAHAVVNDAVTITRQAGRKTDGFAGMVNAVLRRAGAATSKSLDSAPAQPLPAWLRGRMMSAWGKSVTMAIEAAQARGAPIDVTPRSGNALALANALGGLVLPTGSVRLGQGVQVSELPGYAAGDWWVQDAAAAMPARALAVRAGEPVLDLCAAPGGKTLQLAATGAHVTALDLSAQRMGRVTENLSRCRLTAETVVADALDWTPEKPFAAVLLDAPCSATGTIRRHPDLPFVKTAAGLKDLVALQAALIDRALGFLAEGGRLAFATCSLLPDEGERQVEQALARHPGLTVDRDAVAKLPGVDPGWLTEEGGLRLRPDYWPDVGGMDGFYLAVLRPPSARE